MGYPLPFHSGLLGQLLPQPGYQVIDQAEEEEAHEDPPGGRWDPSKARRSVVGVVHEESSPDGKLQPSRMFHVCPLRRGGHSPSVALPRIGVLRTLNTIGIQPPSTALQPQGVQLPPCNNKGPEVQQQGSAHPGGHYGVNILVMSVKVLRRCNNKGPGYEVSSPARSFPGRSWGFSSWRSFAGR